MKFKNIFIGIAAGLGIGVSIALIMVFIVQPFQAKQEAKNVLSNMGSNIGEITAINTELYSFTGENPLELETDQKGLGEESITTPAAFIFGSTGKKLEIYADFGGQRTREFFLVNQHLLSSMIKSGGIQLIIHPVVSNNSYGLYASEALAESFVLAPEKSWDFFIELLKKGAEVETRDDIINSITNIATKQDINIDAISINNGTFASWLLSNDKDMTGLPIPYLIVNGTPISDDISITDSEELKAVLNGI